MQSGTDSKDLLKFYAVLLLFYYKVLINYLNLIIFYQRKDHKMLEMMEIIQFKF